MAENRYEEHRCPLCLERAYASEIYRKTVDGQRIRRWVGWCNSCDRGFEVVQRLINNHWLTERYRTCERMPDMYDYKHSDWIKLYTPSLRRRQTRQINKLIAIG